MVNRILGPLTLAATFAFFAACGGGASDANGPGGTSSQEQTSPAQMRGAPRPEDTSGSATALGPGTGVLMDAGVIDAVICDCRTNSQCPSGTTCKSPLGSGGLPARCMNDDMTGQCY